MAGLEPRNGTLGPEVTRTEADEADARGSTTALTLQCHQNLQVVYVHRAFTYS